MPQFNLKENYPAAFPKQLKPMTEVAHCTTFHDGDILLSSLQCPGKSTGDSAGDEQILLFEIS